MQPTMILMSISWILLNPQETLLFTFSSLCSGCSYLDHSNTYSDRSLDSLSLLLILILKTFVVLLIYHFSSLTNSSMDITFMASSLEKLQMWHLKDLSCYLMRRKMEIELFEDSSISTDKMPHFKHLSAISPQETGHSWMSFSRKKVEVSTWAEKPGWSNKRNKRLQGRSSRRWGIYTTFLKITLQKSEKSSIRKMKWMRYLYSSLPIQEEKLK